MKLQFDKNNPECIQDYQSMLWKDLFKKYNWSQYYFTALMWTKPRLKQAFTEWRVCNKCSEFKVWDCFSISKNWYNKKSSVCKYCTSIHYTKQRKTVSTEAMWSDRVLNTERWDNPPVSFWDWKPWHAYLFNKTLY